MTRPFGLGLPTRELHALLATYSAQPSKAPVRKSTLVQSPNSWAGKCVLECDPRTCERGGHAHYPRQAAIRFVATSEIETTCILDPHDVRELIFGLCLISLLVREFLRIPASRVSLSDGRTGPSRLYFQQQLGHERSLRLVTTCYVING